jgi:hypothetical protein
MMRCRSSNYDEGVGDRAPAVVILQFSTSPTTGVKRRYVSLSERCVEFKLNFGDHMQIVGNWTKLIIGKGCHDIVSCEANTWREQAFSVAESATVPAHLRCSSTLRAHGDSISVPLDIRKPDDSIALES